ncbi:hypothetical protein JY742_05705 [Clostridioides difficile]|nr:hypothetical protein [Clostridioides difficile]
MATVYEFNYTGSEQSVTLKPGKYQIECWGANGGFNTSMSADKYKNACGGYTVGTFLFNENKTIYIYVGKEGTVESVDFNNPSRRGFNGAGLSYEYTSSVLDVAFDGGGATDVRTVGGAWDNPQGLLSRFIVAGGGGGWTNDKYTGGTGKGGGLTSNDLEFCTGASQIAGGVVNKDYPAYMNGSFGKGGGKIGYAVGSSRVKYGGGGGWFGGACGLTTSGSGGSGYLLSVNSYKPDGYLVDSSFYALDGSTNSLTPETYNSPIFPSCHGFCRITLLQGFMSINVNSYTSTQAKFTVSHTEEGALKKIDWYLDGVLKETFMTDLYTEKIINYKLTDNAIHTLKIVVTDNNNKTVEKVISISKSIMPLEDDASLQDIASKVSEIKEGLINGKNSIINVLALKNIESSLNNSLVELSEKVKESFDSSDTSVQELQNQLTEKNSKISQLNNTITDLNKQIGNKYNVYTRTIRYSTASSYATPISEGGYSGSGSNYYILLPFEPKFLFIVSSPATDLGKYEYNFSYDFDYNYLIHGSFINNNDYTTIGKLTYDHSSINNWAKCCLFISTNSVSKGKTILRITTSDSSSNSFGCVLNICAIGK